MKGSDANAASAAGPGRKGGPGAEHHLRCGASRTPPGSAPPTWCRRSRRPAPCGRQPRPSITCPRTGSESRYSTRPRPPGTGGTSVSPPDSASSAPGPGPPDGGSACTACRVERAAQARALKVARRAVRLCGYGRRPVRGGKLCAKCLGLQAARRGRLAAAGLCERGRTPTPGFKTCRLCRRRVADHRARVVAAGRCERCPAPARPGRVTCARCAGRPARRAARRRLAAEIDNAAFGEGAGLAGAAATAAEEQAGPGGRGPRRTPDPTGGVRSLARPAARGPGPSRGPPSCSRASATSNLTVSTSSCREGSAATDPRSPATAARARRRGGAR